MITLKNDKIKKITQLDGNKITELFYEDVLDNKGLMLLDFINSLTDEEVDIALNTLDFDDENE
jgi:hypothetical protein